MGLFAKTNLQVNGKRSLLTLFSMVWEQLTVGFTVDMLNYCHPLFLKQLLYFERNSVCCLFVGLFFLLLRLDATVALDFVWTCFHSPRLWQGRDQKSTAVGSQGSNSVSLNWF